MSEAEKIIAGSAVAPGFMVRFDVVEGDMRRGDHFPDKHAGEPLIETEGEAWVLARKFAAQTFGRCVNVRVVRSDFTPVAGSLIENR